MRPTHRLVLWLLLFTLAACDSDDPSTDNGYPKGSNDVSATQSKSQSKSKSKSKKDKAKPFDLAKQRLAYKLTPFSILDISESPYDNGPALSVSFSVPLDLSKNIQPHLSVFDKNDLPVEGGWLVNHSRTRVYFDAIEANSEYRVVVAPGVTSINSQTLPEKKEKTIKTNRLQSSVSFATKGQILPSKLTRGLPVESVNVEAVDIDFHRVYQKDMGRLLRERLNGYSYYVRELPNYSELAYTARYALDYVKNKKRTTILPIQNVKALNEPGLYIAVMKPAGKYPYDYQVTSFYLSNLALQVTNLEKESHLYTLAINDGKAMGDVELSILSKDGKIQQKVKTSALGDYATSRLTNDSVIVAQKDNDFAIISLSAPALDLSEQLSITRIQQDQELFLYGPRDLYRPGESVMINGILRGVDGETIASVPLEAKLLRPDGRLARTFSWHPQQVGFYSKELTFDKNEPTGEWTLEIAHPSGAKFRYAFSIEAFLPETMKLNLSSDNKPFEPSNKDIVIKGQGDYLYGAPAAGNTISANLKIKPNHYPIDSLNDFYFGKAKEKSESSNQSFKEVELDDQALNAKGEVSWLLPNVWQSQQFPTELVFEASLFESGGRPVTRRYRQNIWTAKSHIGLRTLFTNDASKNRQIKIAEPFQTADFELIKSSFDGTLAPLGQLEISLIREDTQYFWRQNHYGWGYGQTDNETKVYSRILDTSQNRESLSLPVEYGTYRVEIREVQGELKNSYRFFAGWTWDENGESGVAGARPDKVRIQLDKENYRAGDTAKVTLTTPNLGNALVRIEADGLLWDKQIAIKDHETVVEIPVQDGWNRHDIYVTAMVVSEDSAGETPGKANNSELPRRALGVLAFPLNRSDRQFKLTLDSPELVEPDQTITVNIKREPSKQKVQTGDNNSNAENKKGWVTLAAVDTGVLSLSAFETPDPFEWFYGQRAYQGSIRDSYSYLIKNKEGRLGVHQFGGDAELARGGEAPTTDVQIVSLFSELVAFDENGMAAIELTLPKFNGELRLMAVAFSDNEFASSDKTMKVRAPVVAELSKPRFLSMGDKSYIALDLQNLSGKEQILKAVLKFTEAIGNQSKVIEEVLADQGKTTQTLPISGDYIGRGHISLDLISSNGELKLTRSWFIDVRPPYPAEYKRVRQVIQSSEKFALSPTLVRGYEPESLQAILNLSITPPLDSQSHLQGLLQYPYGCLEQTSSRAWPLLKYDASSQVIKLDNRSKKILQEKNKHIQSAIQRINGMQRGNGSFGLWSNQSPENHWLTVYALDFLLQAKSNGYSVPDAVITKGLERLGTYVSSVRPSYSERSHYTENAAHYGLAYRAYAAYVLAQQNKISRGQLRPIDKKMAGKTQSALPLAHLAIAYEKIGDTKSAKIMWNKVFRFKKYSTRYSGDYGSMLRDTAWVMMLAMQSQFDLDYQDLIYGINDRIIEKRWFSTQERFALYRLAVTLENEKVKNWQANLNLASGNEIIGGTQKAYSKWLKSQLFTKDANVELEEGKQLYVDLQLSGYPIEAPSQVSDGIRAEKRYYNLQGKPIQLSKVKSGDYVIARMDVNAERKIPDALLVDFIPAGFELENPGLEFSLDYSDIKIGDSTINEWEYSSEVLHREYRDDRFVAAISLDGRQSSVVFYVMRAVTPGTYQVPSTQVEDMYRPYLRALSAPKREVVVTER